MLLIIGFPTHNSSTFFYVLKDYMEYCIFILKLKYKRERLNQK